MKWHVTNKTALKRLRNSNFQFVVSLLYAQYPIIFFLSYKYYCHALPGAKKRKSLNLQIWIDKFVDRDFYLLFQLGSMVVQQLINCAIHLKMKTKDIYWSHKV